MQIGTVSRLCAGDLEDSKSTSRGILYIFGSHTSVPISWMCKEQTSVSHSFTGAESFLSDAGLHMDGIPAFTLWDLVIEVFHSVPNRTDGPRRERRGNHSPVVKPNMHNPIPLKRTNVIPTNIVYIPPNTTLSGFSAMLYVFEDKEAVVKMIIKGRNPTTRHVSRTHRVALDWLFDRINLDSKIQIRYLDTKHHLADMLTKGNFTRDEWNNLLHLFNISHFSSICCTKNFRWISCSTMAKRIQDQKEEDRVVSKSRPAAMNLSSFIATSSSSHQVRLHLNVRGCRQLRGNPTDEQWTKLIRRSVDFSSATKGCVPWRVMVKQRWNHRIKKKKIQKTPTILRLRPGITKENPLPKTMKLGCNPLHSEPVL